MSDSRRSGEALTIYSNHRPTTTIGGSGFLCGKTKGRVHVVRWGWRQDSSTKLSGLPQILGDGNRAGLRKGSSGIFCRRLQSSLVIRKRIRNGCLARAGPACCEWPAEGTREVARTKRTNSSLRETERTGLAAVLRSERPMTQASPASDARKISTYPPNPRCGSQV
jgi:hypothetical protein